MFVAIYYTDNSFSLFFAKFLQKTLSYSSKIELSKLSELSTLDSRPEILLFIGFSDFFNQKILTIQLLTFFINL